MFKSPFALPLMHPSLAKRWIFKAMGSATCQALERIEGSRSRWIDTTIEPANPDTVGRCTCTIADNAIWKCKLKSKMKEIG